MIRVSIPRIAGLRWFLFMCNKFLYLLVLIFAGTHLLKMTRAIIPTAPIELSQDPCPVVLGCKCVGYDVTNVECSGIGTASVIQLVEHYPLMYSLVVREWKEADLNLDVFTQFSSLHNLSITESELDAITISEVFPTLSHLILDNDMLTDFEQICNITRNMPSLVDLSLRSNQFTELTQCIEDLAIETLDLHGNKITVINNTINQGIRNLDLSFNLLNSTTAIHSSLSCLNMSHNPVTATSLPVFPSLEVLDLSGTKFKVAPQLSAPMLTELIMDGSSVEIIDFKHWFAPNLRRLSLINSMSLKFISGQIPEATDSFYLTNSKLVAFPQSFFKRSSLVLLNISGTDFDCDPCVMQWAIPVAVFVKNQTKCPQVSSLSNCTLGISQHDPDIVRAEMGQSVILPCTAYGTPEPTIEWWLYRPATFLGSFDPVDDVGNSSHECCSILGGGALLLQNVNRSNVERYVCIAKQASTYAHRVVHFRLDYSSWYSLDLFESVFWGGIATAVLACSFSFLLNITWILTRKSILWWIQRAERLSRVRKMVEAMEKYRARQMEGLQAAYARRMQLVRENYHAQVEQLRQSYASQAEKFRDYRAAQMENMSSHLENIRENYNQQMQRVREYGSRRAEQLWESYERQVNRVKAFSLQHRLKMMRQYKVKQRYLNRLLESFQDSTVSPEALRQQEQEVRAALEMPVPPVSPTEPRPIPLSRASSFYSLPEYIIDDEGELRTSPIVERLGVHGTDTENQRSIGEWSSGSPDFARSKSSVRCKNCDPPSSSD